MRPLSMREPPPRRPGGTGGASSGSALPSPGQNWAGNNRSQPGLPRSTGSASPVFGRTPKADLKSSGMVLAGVGTINVATGKSLGAGAWQKMELPPTALHSILRFLQIRRKVRTHSRGWERSRVKIESHLCGYFVKIGLQMWWYMRNKRGDMHSRAWF